MLSVGGRGIKVHAKYVTCILKSLTIYFYYAKQPELFTHIFSLVLLLLWQLFRKGISGNSWKRGKNRERKLHQLPLTCLINGSSCQRKVRVFFLLTFIETLLKWRFNTYNFCVGSLNFKKFDIQLPLGRNNAKFMKSIKSDFDSNIGIISIVHVDLWIMPTAYRPRNIS